MTTVVRNAHSALAWCDAAAVSGVLLGVRFDLGLVFSAALLLGLATLTFSTNMLGSDHANPLTRKESGPFLGPVFVLGGAFSEAKSAL